MANAGGHAQHHRLGKLLRNGERRAGKIVGLLRIRRLEHDDACRAGVLAIILFVLTRRHAWVVCRNQHQAAGDAAIGCRKQHIGRDIDANVFHRHQSARAAKGRAHADFKGDFFVRRPLRLAAEQGKGLENLGRWRSRIPRAKQYTSIQGGQGDGFVTGNERTLRYF